MTNVYRLHFIDQNGVPYATVLEAEDLDQSVCLAKYEWPPVAGYTLIAAKVENNDFTWTDIVFN